MKDMTDYISREAFSAEMKERQTEAEKWLREAKDRETAIRADAVLSFLCEVKLTLEKIPAADVREVKRGKWIVRHKRDWFVCSECSYESNKASNFCPNCGADMRGRHEAV